MSDELFRDERGSIIAADVVNHTVVKKFPHFSVFSFKQYTRILYIIITEETILIYYICGNERDDGNIIRTLWKVFDFLLYTLSISTGRGTKESFHLDFRPPSSNTILYAVYIFICHSV